MIREADDERQAELNELNDSNDEYHPDKGDNHPNNGEGRDEAVAEAMVEKEIAVLASAEDSQTLVVAIETSEDVASQKEHNEDNEDNNEQHLPESFGDMHSTSAMDQRHDNDQENVHVS